MEAKKPKISSDETEELQRLQTEHARTLEALKRTRASLPICDENGKLQFKGIAWLEAARLPAYLGLSANLIESMREKMRMTEAQTEAGEACTCYALPDIGRELKDFLLAPSVSGESYVDDTGNIWHSSIYLAQKLPIEENMLLDWLEARTSIRCLTVRSADTLHTFFSEDDIKTELTNW